MKKLSHCNENPIEHVVKRTAKVPVVVYNVHANENEKQENQFQTKND